MRIHYPKLFDPILVVVPIIIVLLSIFTLYSTSPDLQLFAFNADNVVLKQAVFFLVAFLIMIALSRIDLSWSESIIVQVTLIGGSIILLAGLFVLGGLVNATRRWYVIGPFLLQPSEFVKYIIIMWTAFFLTRKNGNMFHKVAYLLGGITLTLGLIFMQPDAGTTIMASGILAIMIAVWSWQYPLGKKTVMLICSIGAFGVAAIAIHPIFLIGIIIMLGLLSYQDIRFLKVGGVIILISVIFAGIGVGMWQSNIIKDYQKQRVLTFLGVEEETFQVKQSKIAIGSGQLLGKGVGQGTQSRLRFLPEYRTDFIFAAFAEERGFVGALVIIVLYLILIVRMFIIALEVKDDYVKLVALGLAIKLWIEVFVNIGMNLGLLPTKGVALPFMSYGGSSLLSNFILIGLFQAIYISHFKNDKILETKSFPMLV